MRTKYLRHLANIVDMTFCGVGLFGGGGGGARRVSRNSQETPFFFFFFFFFAFQFFRGGGPAQKLAEKMTISTKKVAKYR